MAVASSVTRAQIQPTVRHATRISCETAVLRRLDRQPRDLIFEAARERRVVPGPRDRRDNHAVTLAANPRRVGLEIRERGAEVQRPPTPAPLTEVITRAAPPAMRTAIPLPCARADRHHQRARVGQLDVLHDSSPQTEELLPYPSCAHAATALSRGSTAVRSPNRESTTACAPSCPEVGRAQRPDLIATKRGRRRPSSSANPPTSSENVSRAAPASKALLDQTQTGRATPRPRSPHPRNMQGSLKWAMVGLMTRRLAPTLGRQPW